MDLDPGEANPMWARRTALAASPYVSHRDAAPRDEAQACRIALPLADVHTILADERVAERLTQVITWDAPLTLLADEHDLVERVQAAGLRVPVRGGTYAERQWDAREALEEAAHRHYDHGESAWGVRGIITGQPHFTVVIVEGASSIRSLLVALLEINAAWGVLVDARDAMDLRAFCLESLAHDRVIFMRGDGTEELRRHALLEAVEHILRPPGSAE